MRTRGAPSPELLDAREKLARTWIVLRCKKHGNVRSWSQKLANERPGTTALEVAQLRREHGATCDARVEVVREERT